MINIVSIVYLYGFNTRNTTRLENLIGIIREQIKLGALIKLVLIHDGVIGISKKGNISKSLLELLNLPIYVYALSSDLKARGIDLQLIHEKIHIIGYEELVDILVDSMKIVSWI